MQIYLFISRSSPSIRAFTADATGGNLPSEYAPWGMSGNGSAVPTGNANAMVTQTVEKEGFFLMMDSVARHPRENLH